ncbi:MAG: FAD binding domain-containing protein [Rhizobiales bacterium]|nr:FAD binding domain-containing protein [Hyphomicrobiales bacterium]
MGRYERPPELAEALEFLSGGSFAILAGGTDFYPARATRPVSEDVLDLTGIAALKGIRETPDHWRIGALTTWSELIAAPLPALFDGYKLAAREVGGRQIQNTGTLAGNLCNASPAADGTPNLVALDALVELASPRGTRLMPVGDFVTGNRKTARGADEIVTALLVPKRKGDARSTFVKLGARKYLVISIAMVAAVIEAERNIVTRAALAVGSCSLIARRLPELERALIGAAIDRLDGIVSPEHLGALAPISDVRATAEYRQDAAVELVRRALRSFAPC